MKKLLKILSICLLTFSLVSFLPTKSSANHRDKYGHSWLNCFWHDMNVVVFGYVIKESDPLH